MVHVLGVIMLCKIIMLCSVRIVNSSIFFFEQVDVNLVVLCINF